MFPIRDSIPRRRFPAATWLLILANGLAFLFELALPPPALEAFIRTFGIVPARIVNAEWAPGAGFLAGGYGTLLTSMFLHGGWLHIIGNMWSLWIFGDNVEDRMGPARFLLFYLACGLTAGIAHTVASPGSAIPTIGASGAVAGVMGAYFFLFPSSRVTVLAPILFVPVFFEVPTVFYLGIWILTQVYSGTLSLAGGIGGIAWWAHVGGFLAGVLLRFLFVRGGRGTPRYSSHRQTAD